SYAGMLKRFIGDDTAVSSLRGLLADNSDKKDAPLDAPQKPATISDTADGAAKFEKRRTPLVEAVEKVSPALGSVRAKKNTNWGSKEVAGGVISIDSRGYYITSGHVVEGAKETFITPTDGKPQQAEVVFMDKANDIAVLKLKAPEKDADK